MATFTLKMTIAGTVAGRAINYTKTTTLTGIEAVVTDRDICDSNGGVSSLVLGSGSRGESGYAAAAFAMVTNTTSGGLMMSEDDTLSLALHALPGIPVLYWQSYDYDACLYSDTSTGSPNTDYAGGNLYGMTGPCSFSAVGLYKPIT